MQIIHCTKKLLNELGALGSKMPAEQPTGIFGPWHANLIRDRTEKVHPLHERSYALLVPRAGSEEKG